MATTQADRRSVLLVDPAASDETNEGTESAFEAAMADRFDVHRTTSVPTLEANAPYAALLYRWRSGEASNLEALLSSLPAEPSLPVVVAGPNEPTAVRTALVTTVGGRTVDDYVSADANAAATLAERLSAESEPTKQVGITAADTAALDGAIVEQMQDTAWVLDEELRISYVNHRLVERLGIPATGLIGTPFEASLETALEPEPFERFRAGLRAVLAGREPRVRIQLAVSPDAAPAYTTEVLVQPYRDATGEITGVVGIGRDIGERLAHKRALERQNELFEEAQQLADVGSWALDVESETMELTEAVYSIYELPHDTEPTLSTLLEYHPEEAAIRSAFEGLAADEEADLETRVVTASGTEKWVRIHGTPRLTDGRVTELIGSVQDVTERHELEAEREAIVDSLQRLYAVSADTDLSFEERIQRVLELACERLGLAYGFLTAIDESTQEIVYATGEHERLQPGERAPLSTAYCRRTIERDALLTVENAVAEGWADDPAYQTYGLACYVGGKVSVAGRPYGTLCFADTETRARSFSETELAFVEVLTTWVSYHLEQRETESRLRALQETTQAFLTAADESAVVELAITAAVDVLALPLTGLWRYEASADRLVAVSETDAASEEFGPQADLEPGEGLIWQAFADGEPTVFNDVEANPERYNPDTDVTAEAVVPVPDYGVLASATLEESGISELDFEMLRILATSLSAAMKRVDRTRELERQNERLSAFTGYVSHDLRNPLSVASGFVDHVLESGEIKELQRVQRAHERMQRLIEDMLLLARRGDVIGETEPTDVIGVAERAWNAIDAPAATLRTEGSLTVVADESRLQQVFENVFRNAVEHGGREVTVTVTASETALTVENDGRRFDVDPASLFDPDSSVIETGLGLSIVAEIVDAHGWAIAATHREPTGARFEITGFEPLE